MPVIFLKGPAIINGAVRYPVEGGIPVTEDEAERLLAGSHIDEKKTFADADGDHEEDQILEDMTVDQLKQLAGEEAVDLSGVTKKDDIIAAIRAHRAPAE